MATIRKKGKTWQVVIRKKDGHGATYKSGFHTKQEAKDWASDEEGRRRQENYFPAQIAKKHTLAKAIDAYIELIPSLKHKSTEDILRHLNWWKQKLGEQTLARITPEVIAKHRKKLQEGITIKGTQRTNATVNRYLASLSMVLSHVVKECGWISTNPMLRVSKLKESGGRNRILSKEECDRLLTSCAMSKNASLLLIVTLAITTGMRQGKILKLTWKDVDLNQEIISLKETKNGKPRSVPIAKSALEELKKLAKNRNLQIPFLFPSKKRFGQITIRKAWDEAVARCGIEDLHFQDLRHTFCTYAAKTGALNFQLQRAMGHSSPEMTAQYTHLEVDHIRHLSDFVEANLLTPSGAVNGAN